MRSGRLRERVTLQRATLTRDATGDAVPTWTDLGTRWAAVEPVAGGEVWTEAQETASQTMNIILRHDPVTATLTPADRLSHNGRLYDIVSVLNRDFRDRELQLTATWRQLPEIYP